MKANNCAFGIVFAALILCAGAWEVGGIRAARASHSGELCGTIDTNVSHGRGMNTVTRQRGWWAEARKNIGELEYHVTSVNEPAGNQGRKNFQAPNRAHNLRTFYSESGIRIGPRRGRGDEWSVALELKKMGRGASKTPLPRDETPDVRGPRVEFHRGSVIEWYVNRPVGVEQGFTITQRPAGGGELSLYLAVQGNLSPKLVQGGRVISFRSEGADEILRYSKLHVFDRNGTSLPSHFELTGRSIKIAVDDDNAVYPIVIDPLFTAPPWSYEGNQEGAHFGSSVDTAGDVNGDGFSDIIVSTPDYDNGATNGKVFVFYGSLSGPNPTPSWTAVNAQAGSQFGYAAGTAGDVNGDGVSDIIVGAPYYSNELTNEGAAFIYFGSINYGLSLTGNTRPTGTFANADWSSEGNNANALFGFAVAAAGDVNGDDVSDIIVGAPNYTDAYAEEGRVFIFHGADQTGPSQSANRSMDSNQANSHLGYSVSTAGDVNGDGYSDVVIGVPDYDYGQPNEGMAWVYHGSGTGLGGLIWYDDNNIADASFGISVSTAGDVDGDGYSDVIVGASGSSSVYVYFGSSSGLVSTGFWNRSGDTSYGHAVSTAGDVNGDGFGDIIVGAPLADSTYTNCGRVDVYLGSVTGLGVTPVWFIYDLHDYGQLGYSVATAGDINGDGYSDIIFGEDGKGEPGEWSEGKAYVYMGGAESLAASSTWVVESGQANADFGFSVGSAGDVNGDGYDDVIVGALYYDNGQNNEGIVFVYHGSMDGLNTSLNWYAQSDADGAQMGNAVAGAGDVNGDGYGDVIVGAHAYNNGAAYAGKVYLYYGSATGLVSTGFWTVEGTVSYEWLGDVVGAAGDVNGDGFGDVIIFSRSGPGYVYHGSSSGLGSSPAWTDDFAYTANTAGDVNGDGYSDIIVGNSSFSHGQESEGRAYVHLGSADGLEETFSWEAEGNEEYAYFGQSVSSAGDVNRDGYSDVVVGASGALGDKGKAYVFHGSSTGVLSSASWEVEGAVFGQSLGHLVANAGDVNGDGFGDVIVGSYSGNYINLYQGSDDGGLSDTPSWSITQSGGFGRTGATAGDVNGDGFSDIAVGAPDFTNGQSSEGKAFVYYGNGSIGRGVGLQQLRTDGSTPIAQLGMSDAEAAFVISILGRSPMGREDIQLEWEVKPSDVLFDGSGTELSVFHDSDSSGYSFFEPVSDLIGHTDYHWRARIRYRSGNPMGLVAGRWLSPFPSNSAAVDFRTSNNPPVGGYIADNAIPVGQVTQSGSGDGIVTIQFRIKDAGINQCTLQNFNFYVSGWNALASESGSLGGSWPDNDGSLYVSAPDWTGPVHSFTFNTKHSDVASYFTDTDNFNVRIAFRLNDGQDTSAFVYTEYFRVDNLVPTTGSVVITDNSGYTNDSTPSLTLSSTDADWMSFALYEGGPWTGPYTYNTSFNSYSISTDGNGPKTVWVEFKDQSGNVQTTHAFDNTVYDTVVPTGSVNINGGDIYTNSVSVILTLDASDTYGVTEMQFSNNGNTYSSPEPYDTVRAWALAAAEGTRTVYARFRDQAGNWSSPVTDTIILDSLGPVTGSIIIEGDEAFVDLENVTLNLSATDSSGISRMRFSNDGDTYDAPVSYATTTSWNLLTGDGNKTVYVQFEDQAENWSLAFSDTVYLDMTPPVSQISSPEYASGDSLTLTWNVNDGDGSGVQETTFLSKRLAGANWNRELLTVPPGDFEFSDFSGDGDYYFALVSTDNLDNVEPDPADVGDQRVTHTIYDSGNPCSEATDLSFDEASGAYTITYIYDDIYAGESPCQGASSGSGVVQVALHVVKPDASEEVITVSGGDLANPIEYTPPEGEEGLYGFYTIATDTAGNVEDAPASGVDLETIYSVDFPGYAILAVGSIASDPVGLLSHTKTANNVYAHLINRNFALVDSVEKWHDPYDQIRYYNPYSVGQLGEDDIGFSYMGTMLDTVTNWAMDKMRLRPGPLYIILINHGSDDRFYLEPPAFFTAQNLSDWLDALEGDMAAESIAPQKIVVVIGTCQSGSFMGDLAKENRIIVASSAGNEPSYRGPMEPGGVRDGEFFTTSFFNALGQGYDLKTSYQRAVERVEIHTDSGESNSPEPYFDSARQHPHLEDDGLAPFGSHTPIVGGDGDAAAEIYLGAKKGDFEPLLITSIDKPEAPLSSGEFMASFSIKISDATRRDIAWMEVRSPDLILDESSDPSQQEIVDLAEAPMTWNESSQKFEGNFFDFFLEGRYSVFFYIRDIDSGIVSPPAMTYVYKEKSSGANNPPGSFSLLMPEEGTGWHTTFEGFGAAWEQSIDPDGDAVTYTIEIRHDETDSRWDIDTFSYKREGILKNNVLVGQEANFVDLRYYKWQIVAVDQYGEKTFSNEEWRFEIDDTDPFPGYLDIFVYDASNNQGIANANLLSDGGHAIVSTGGGYYFGTGSPGPYTLDVQASGYHAVTDLPLNVLEGSFVVMTVGLNAMEPEKFGDVDGTPPVNLADAVLTMQIMGGLEPGAVDLDADVDGDGKISMPELIFILQKVAGLRE